MLNLEDRTIESKAARVSTSICCWQDSVSERQMSETGCRRGVPFLPQSLTVVPPNINWQHGTRSKRSPLLAPYIRMKHNILVFQHSECLCGSGAQLCICVFKKILELCCWRCERREAPRPTRVAIRAPLPVSLRRQVQGCSSCPSAVVHLSEPAVAFGKLAPRLIWLGKHP